MCYGILKNNRSVFFPCIYIQVFFPHAQPLRTTGQVLEHILHDFNPKGIQTKTRESLIQVVSSSSITETNFPTNPTKSVLHALEITHMGHGRCEGNLRSKKRWLEYTQSQPSIILDEHTIDIRMNDMLATVNIYHVRSLSAGLKAMF